MAANRREPNNVTIYNVSKKLVSKDGNYGQQIRFKYAEAFDGYAGVTVPQHELVNSANPNFYHVRMPKDMTLTLSYKTGIRKDDVATKEISPREFKDLFEKTRLPKKKPTKQGTRMVEMNAELEGNELLAEMQAQAAVHDMEDTLPF